MRAMRFHEHGGPEVLRLDEIEPPAPGPGEVLLEVRASSLNHLDLWVRNGLEGIPVPLPHIPGCDAAGVVAALGPGARGVAVGDRVLANPGLSCGRCEFCSSGETSLCLEYQILGEHRDGAWAEHIVLPALNLLPIPNGLSFEEAGCIPLVFLTAWRMLVTKARVRPGQEVLVLGAGSGVGSAAIQIAKLLGARVLATASTEEKRKRALEIGADLALESTAELAKEIRRETAKRGVDVVLDHVGASTWAQSIRCLARGGTLVTCGATSGHEALTDLRHVFFRQLSILGSTMGTRGELYDVLRAFERRELRPLVDSVVPLASAGQAMERLASRLAFGKIAVRVAS